MKKNFLLFVVFGTVNAASSNPDTLGLIGKKQSLPKAPQQVSSAQKKRHKWVAKDLHPTGKKLYQPVQYHPHQETPAWLAKQQQLANEVDKANANARWATQMRANGTYAMPDKAPAALKQLKNAQQNYNEFMTKGD